MPFSAAARTSPCSWEPYLSNDVQNTNNNQPERRQPVKQKWVVVAKATSNEFMTPKTFFANIEDIHRNVPLLLYYPTV